MNIWYFIITFLACTAGAVTGMGGGILIKPILDSLGGYDVATIGVLSSIAVFVMCLVSACRMYFKKVKAELKIPFLFCLALGSSAGGIAGKFIFEKAVGSLNAGYVTIIQNVIIAVLLVAIFIFMLKKDNISTFTFVTNYAGFFTGFILGICSSFLGIGGGPINVAALILLFSLDTRTSALASLVSIFFSQFSKIITVMLGEGLASYDLSVLPFMLAGAVLGGLAGSEISSKLSNKQTDKFFNVVLIVVFGICVFNISRVLIFT